MNSKIPFNRLAAIIAEDASISTASAESFIKEFFALISEKVLEGDKVVVKGLGTFSKSDIPDQPVAFEPSSDLAENINAPFSMFSPEELHSAVTNEMLDEITTATSEDDDSEEEVIIERPSVATAEIEIETDDESTDEHQVITPPPYVATDEIAVNKPEPQTRDEKPAATIDTEETAYTPKPVTKIEITQTEDSEDEDDSPDVADENTPAHRGPGFGIGILIGIIIGIAIGAFAVFMFMQTDIYKGTPSRQESLTTDTLSTTEPDTDLMTDSIPVF